MNNASEKLSEWNEHIQAAERAQRSGKYDFAEATWLLAVEEAESFGSTDHRLAYSLEKLTECLWFQGRLQEALHHGCRALSIYEAALGPHHNDVGSMAYNVAMVYHMLNYYAEAESLYKRALAIKTGALGAKHPDVSKVLGSFADLLMKLGRQAEAMQLRATDKMVTATNWSQTASARNVGGTALGYSPSEASVSGTYPSFDERQSISGPLQALSEPGAGKPAHASIIKQIRKASAEHTYQKTKSTPDVANLSPEEVDSRLARHLGPIIGKKAEVQPERHSDDDHIGAKPPQSAAAAAEISYKLILPISGKFGSTWDELKNAAESGMREGNLTKSEGAWREALTIAKGDNPDNPSYCFVLEALGEVYLRQQNYERSEACLVTSYYIKKKVLGEKHIAIAGAASNLARLYYLIYKFGDAEKFGEECIKIQEAISGPQSIEVATAMHNLATVFHVQKKYDRAEPYYERAMKIKQLQLGGDHPDTVRILKSYANLLRATHRDEQADHLDSCVTGMISGRWRALTVKDMPQEGWWKQEVFGDE